MENSKWIKLASKEEILKLKEDKNFKFSVTSLSKYFNIPVQRIGELLKYYEIGIIKLTKNVKLTTEEWKNTCNIIHNNYFDYSKSVYINGKTLIIIGCPIHGDVMVNPNRHKNGGKCKRCSAKERSIFKPINKKVYLLDANKTHNNKYDYSLMEDFKTVNEKISIICPIHGVFKQYAHSHRKGSGCEKCSYVERGNNTAVSFNEYLERAYKKFGDLYKYIEDSYSLINNNVTYICEIHGEVSQKAETHLKSRGCAKCFRKNERSNTKDFIIKAIEKHNSFYIYPRTEYGNSNRDKIIITCPFHGDFEQQPNTHLSGGGCKTCANIKSNLGYSNLSKEDIKNSKLIPCKLYVLRFISENMEYYKIGISTSFNRRLTKLRSAHKAKIDELFILDSNLFNCATIEGELLKKYKKYNKRGEVPFNIEGSTECLSIKTPIQEIISYLESI